MKISFFGAAGQVTGSMTLIECGGKRILIDCGLDLEKGRMPAQRPNGFPFEASTIDAVILTHAHLDHSGDLPNLFRQGCEASVFCTTATYYLASLLLEDSAKLNDRRRSSKNVRRESKKQLFSVHHAAEALKFFKPLNFRQSKTIADGVKLELFSASHLLGAAHVVIELSEGEKKLRIGFSGDHGRINYPLLPDPDRLPKLDYLVCESTYGARTHSHQGSGEEILEAVINKSCVERPGKLIIPAFSVGRSQALLFTLNKLSLEGRLPRIPVYVDSPLAISSTRVHEKMKSFLSDEAKEMMRNGEELFDFENLHFVKSNSSSKALSDHFASSILITSSGMMEGGRVQYHLRRNIENNRCTFFLVGYSAEGTLGNRLMNGAEHIYVNGKKLKVNATIERSDVFSGHGDLHDLLALVGSQQPEMLKGIFLVHGEEEGLENFRTELQNRDYKNIAVPQLGESFEL